MIMDNPNSPNSTKQRTTIMAPKIEISKDTKIKLTDGREVFLKDMTQEMLVNVPKDGKEVDGKFTSITCKKTLISETVDQFIERRLLQNADWPRPAMFDITLPKTWAGLTKEDQDEVVENYVQSKRVKEDHDHSTKESTGKRGMSPEDREKYNLVKGATPEQMEAIRAILADVGINVASTKEVAETLDKAKKDMKKHGFAK